MDKKVFNLLEIARLHKEELYSKFGTSQKGFDNTQVENSRQEYGENILISKKKKTQLQILIEAFLDPFTILLFVIANISLVTDYIMSDDKDLSSFIIIMVILIFSGLLQYIQEKRSNEAAEKLAEMIKSTIVVIRDGKEEEIDIKDIVIGDIVSLASGDMIPADMRIIECKDLFISQSSLTGESEPVEKLDDIITDEENPLDLDNIGFMGTNVVSGSGLAIVVNIGNNTVFGKIAKRLDDKKEITNFEKQLNSISFLLIKLMIIVVPIVFVLQGFESGNWLDSFVFAITVAVGLTPTMLPTVISVNLAKNSHDLSKHKVIVKNLNSIHNLGSMDVLCTDKTGTITQDKVTMMHAYNTSGDEDIDIIKYAYLNSYYHTGLRNLIDKAVIDYAKKHLSDEISYEYEKINEIPFDFNRRRMTVIVRNKDKNILIAKGALEEILNISTHAYIKDDVVPLDENMRNQYEEMVADYNKKGLRVVAIGIREDDMEKTSYSLEDEENIILLGFLAFLDPPKESSKEAIKGFYENGIDIKVLTGDNKTITKIICDDVKIPTDKILLGTDIDKLGDEELIKEVENTSVFVKLSPEQKLRIVKLIQKSGKTVGYLGDGINDAPSLNQADVGISVDTAVDIAKESANIILLEKDLTILKDGIIYGRKAHINIMKYIKSTISVNFGYMLTMLVSSLLLPFYPMLPTQLLIFNLIYDISSLATPWDNVDKEMIKRPSNTRKLTLNQFMYSFGPITTIFDIITFLLLFFVLIPNFLNQGFTMDNKLIFASLFQTSWFVSSLWTQSSFIHLIRTEKIPFLQSRASLPLIGLSFGAAVFGFIMPIIPLGKYLKLNKIPYNFYPVFLLILLGYILTTLLVKKLYINKYKELL